MRLEGRASVGTLAGWFSSLDACFALVEVRLGEVARELLEGQEKLSGLNATCTRPRDKTKLEAGAVGRSLAIGPPPERFLGCSCPGNFLTLDPAPVPEQPSGAGSQGTRSAIAWCQGISITVAFESRYSSSLVLFTLASEGRQFVFVVGCQRCGARAGS